MTEFEEDELRVGGQLRAGLTGPHRRDVWRSTWFVTGSRNEPPHGGRGTLSVDSAWAVRAVRQSSEGPLLRVPTLPRDLFGDWILVKVWGGWESSRGRLANAGVASYPRTASLRSMVVTALRWIPPLSDYGPPVALLIVTRAFCRYRQW